MQIETDSYLPLCKSTTLPRWNSLSLQAQQAANILQARRARIKTPLLPIVSLATPISPRTSRKFELLPFSMPELRRTKMDYIFLAPTYFCLDECGAIVNRVTRKPVYVLFCGSGIKKLCLKLAGPGIKTYQDALALKDRMYNVALHYLGSPAIHGQHTIHCSQNPHNSCN